MHTMKVRILINTNDRDAGKRLAAFVMHMINRNLYLSHDQFDDRDQTFFPLDYTLEPDDVE